jgi:hypothetical protein
MANSLAYDSNSGSNPNARMSLWPQALKTSTLAGAGLMVLGVACLGLGLRFCVEAPASALGLGLVGLFALSFAQLKSQQRADADRPSLPDAVRAAALMSMRIDAEPNSVRRNPSSAA